MASPPPAKKSKASHDSSFYLDCTPVVFQVEDTLFRFPRQAIMESSIVFREMLTVPPSPANEGEGTCDENPIVLQDSKDDFTALMDYLHPYIKGHIKEIDQWISILKLAHKYQMDLVFDHAIEQLEDQKDDLEPLQLFVLARDFSEDLETCEEWKNDALYAFITRNYPPSLSEATELGMELSVAIFRVREFCDREGHQLGSITKEEAVESINDMLTKTENEGYWPPSEG
ncbi:hypothetical protein DL96DRAFT_1644360 [Flagelloscypha sp. PMI_526]|nr:hypothetical protein DL96DRAFT_1644360 [Flagelloscypha sp. PMI_526]